MAVLATRCHHRGGHAGRRRDVIRLHWGIVTKSLASFAAITFTLCVAYGLILPIGAHPSWLLEAILPAFKWLTIGSFLLGLIEVSLYGAWVGALYSALYNFFARRANRDAAKGNMNDLSDGSGSWIRSRC